MTLRPGSLILFIVAIVVLWPPNFATAQPGPRHVKVTVDSIMAAYTKEGFDARLLPFRKQLEGLFTFTTYSLANHQSLQTECGQMVVFMLPGGKILHVQPREVDDDMIAMEIILFDGTKPMMTTDVKLKNNGLLIIGGPHYEQGMLIISIGASTGDSPLAQPQSQAALPAYAAVH